MARRAKSTSAPATTPLAAAEVEPAVTGSEDDYNRFLPAAMKLARVTPFRADASLAYHNVDRGTTSVLSQRALLDARIKNVDWAAISSLPSLALAVCFAAAQAMTAAPETASSLPTLLARARKLRKILLDAAVALASASLVSEQKVSNIRAGKGFIDTAQDCVDLAALFRASAAKIRGKHAVTPEQIAEAATVGTALLKILKPAGSKLRDATPEEIARAQDARDRLWTLLVEGHRELRRLGMFVWVDEVDDHVPALQAHRSAGTKRRKAAAAAPPEPAKPNGVTTAP